MKTAYGERMRRDGAIPSCQRSAFRCAPDRDNGEAPSRERRESVSLVAKARKPADWCAAE